MSVPKFKRKKSTLYVYNEARDIRVNLVKYLIQYLKDERLYKEFLVTEDNTTLSIVESFPKTLVDSIESRIIELLSKLLEAISIADSIYPMSYSELYQRILYQNKAMGLTKAVNQELLFIVDLFPNKLNGILSYADRLDKLFESLKKWKKSKKSIIKRVSNIDKSESKNYVTLPLDAYDD